MAGLIGGPEQPILPQVGDVFGRWRVVEIFHVDGEAWARVVNERNPSTRSRVHLTDLDRLKES